MSQESQINVKKTQVIKAGGLSYPGSVFERRQVLEAEVCFQRSPLRSTKATEQIVFQQLGGVYPQQWPAQQNMALSAKAWLDCAKIASTKCRHNAKQREAIAVHTLRCGPTGLSVCYNFRKNAAPSQSVEITEEQSWCKSNHWHLNATYRIFRVRMSIHQHYCYSFDYFSLDAAWECVWVWISMKNETVKMLKWYTQAHAKEELICCVPM